MNNVKPLTLEQAQLHRIAFENLSNFIWSLQRIYPDLGDKLRELEMNLACEWIDPSFDEVIIDNLPDGDVKDLALKITKQKDEGK